MRLGGPLFAQYADPGAWAAAVKTKGYRAAFCPVGEDASGAEIRAYRDAAARADVVIAEVGAWSGPLGPDPAQRAAAVALCTKRLALAEEIGARCCVNISGSRGAVWNGHDPANLTEETFDLIVATVRTFIDAVRPARTFYALETMPWMYPDSADSYLRLVKAVDRKSFAVHFDPVNLVAGPSAYYATGALIRDFCAKLGPHIRSCHAKDTLLGGDLTVHLAETRPGTGNLDYRAFLSEIDRIDPEMPLMIEHLSNEQEYDLAAAHIRGVAASLARGA